MVKKYFKHLRSAAVNLYEADIMRLLEHDPNALLLDVGCDDGQWTNKIVERIGSNSVIGIDLDENKLSHARRNGIEVVKCDISYGLPFHDSIFDVIHCNQVIEHIYNTELFVKELFRILKPCGYTIVCTENLASWHNILSLTMGWMPMSSSNFSATVYNIGNPIAMHANEDVCFPETWQHIRVLSIRGIKDIFKIHGFRIEKILGSGYYPLPAVFARIDPIHAAFLSCKFRRPK